SQISFEGPIVVAVSRLVLGEAAPVAARKATSVESTINSSEHI
ncbi:hypothetical protein L916_15216, partial [Phytophthora nicotianae]